jgi:phenylalanyl-tRNA synthetase alpha chain
MLDELNDLEARAAFALAAAGDATALETVRLQYFSRNGELAAVTARLKDVPKEEKPAVGRRLNEVKQALESAFEARKEELESARETADLDLTLPGRPVPMGGLHPITQVTDRMVRIFRRLGFSMADGPEIETEFHNFDALNTPADHPARNELDTFYVDRERHPEQGRWLLRTQTSPVQIRTMLQGPPPIRVICPGRCFRRDEIDATHGTSFHQMEGLVVDADVSLAELKGTLDYFFRELCGPGTRLRLRPHFFPFTEPSYEVDLATPALRARGKEWLEIAGCGMVDPRVFRSVGYDPEKVSGYAFGMGVERLTMILHDIPDLRLFEANDLRFLRQFA